jgi:hypothetical protein
MLALKVQLGARSMVMSTTEPARPVSVSVDPPKPSLRRLARKLILLVIAKIAVISLIWWVVAAHYERPDTRPAAIEHLLAPASSSSSPQPGSP